MPTPKPESFVKGNPGAMVMKFALDQAAKRGRGGDTDLGHLTKKDLVIPAEWQKGELDKELSALLKKHKFDRSRYTVGEKGNKIHPETGLPEFDSEGGGEGPGGEGGGSGPGMGADGGDGGPSGGGGPGGGEVGTGHDTGPTSGVGTDMGGAPTGGTVDLGTMPGISITANDQPPGSAPPGVTGIGMIDRALDSFASHPISSTLATAANMAVPALGALSTVSGWLGGPTTQGVMDLLGTNISNLQGTNAPASIGDSPVMGSPTQLGATPLDQMIRNTKVLPA